LRATAGRLLGSGKGGKRTLACDVFNDTTGCTADHADRGMQPTGDVPCLSFRSVLTANFNYSVEIRNAEEYAAEQTVKRPFHMIIREDGADHVPGPVADYRRTGNADVSATANAQQAQG